MSFTPAQVNTDLTTPLTNPLTPRLTPSARKQPSDSGIPRDLVDRYMADINGQKLLDREAEQNLAQELAATGDQRIYHQLVNANLRFVVKVAHEFKGYKVPLSDLIQEGNIGLMMAVNKFDPERGYRLISYAVWWIRAYMQAYVMKSFSLVKIGTTVAQRKLFFKLRSERESMNQARREGTARASDTEVAESMKVSVKEVSQMELRLAARDFSLDTNIGETQQLAFVDMMAHDGPTPEQVVSEGQLRARAREVIAGAGEWLDARERYILKTRLGREEPETLRDVGARLNISRERVRQLQEGIIQKLRQAVEEEPLPALAA